MAYGTVAVTPGVGAGIAVDAIGGSQFQRIKASWGPQGTINEIDTPTPLPVQPVIGVTAVASATPLPVMLGLMPTDLLEVAINVSTSGDNSIVAASAANKVRVWAFWLKVNGSGTGVSLKWKDGAGTDFHPALPFNDKDGWVMGMMGGRPWFTSAVINTALLLNLSAAIQVSGRLYYTLTP